MVQWFRTQITPPKFPEDDEKTRVARSLNIVLLVGVFAAGTYVLLAPFIDPKPFQAVVANMGMLVIYTSMLILIRRGHVAQAAVIFSSIMWLAVTLSVAAYGSVIGPALVSYFTVIAIAGLFLGGRAALTFAGLTILATIGFVSAEEEGLLPPPVFPTSPIIMGWIAAFNFILTGTTSYLTLRSMTEALERAKQQLLDRALAKEQEINRRKMMEKVIRIGKEVTSPKNDLRATLLQIRDSVHNGLDFDRAAIFLFDPNDSTMQGSYGTNRSGNVVEEWGLRFGIGDDRSFFKIVISQPDGYYFTQDYSGERNLSQRPGHPMADVKYYAAVAVWAGDKPVAMICVDQLTSGRSISDEQLEALRFFAGYAGLAIENARLGEREQKRREMMEKVIEIGKKVTEQTTDLHPALFKIRESVRNNLDFDRAAVFLYNPENNTLQGSYGTDRSGNLSEEWDLKNEPLGDGLFNRPDGLYFTKDYDSDFNTASNPEHPMRGVKEYAAVACWSGDKPVGMICVDQLLSGRSITDEQLEALRLFAGYAGLAIENARLNTELKSHMQEREQFIHELGNRNAELERFTYTVSHDLRSPIITIKGFVGMLNKDIQEGNEGRVGKDVQRISNAADKMDALLSDLLELSRIGRVVNPTEEIDLVKLANETLETVDGRLRSKNVSTHISPSLPKVYGDRVRIGEVLENLIDNAAKYMGDQPDPLIEISTRNESGEQIICVKDNGIGVEPQYLQKIFGLFEKLDPTSEGTGIGLALIKRIIEVHGGRIWVESEGSGKGATFCFTIPDNREEA